MSVWAYAAPLRRVAEILDFCAVYFATLWGRCAALSVPLLGIALLLPKLLWKRGPFIKGAVWAVFVSAPFLGKLRVFYESRACLPLILWQSRCSGYCLCAMGICSESPLASFCHTAAAQNSAGYCAACRRKKWTVSGFSFVTRPSPHLRRGFCSRKL